MMKVVRESCLNIQQGSTQQRVVTLTETLIQIFNVLETISSGFTILREVWKKLVWRADFAKFHQKTFSRLYLPLKILSKGYAVFSKSHFNGEITNSYFLRGKKPINVHKTVI